MLKGQLWKLNTTGEIFLVVAVDYQNDRVHLTNNVARLSCYRHTITEYFTQVSRLNDEKCECGAKSIGSSMHSPWCNKGEVYV